MKKLNLELMLNVGDSLVVTCAKINLKSHEMRRKKDSDQGR